MSRSPRRRYPAVVALSLLTTACFNPELNPGDDGDEIDTGTGDSSDSSSSSSTTTTDSTDTSTDTSTSETDSSDGSCSQEGCLCDGPGACDPGLYCDEGTCIVGVCGDGEAQGPESCDDGNDVSGDGCDSDCTFTEVLYVDASFQNTCAMLEGGRVRCWGANYAGQLGYGHTDDIGDDETPASVGDVMLPEPGVELTMGDSHACILMADQAVRCWGVGSSGQLGYGNTNNIGDDEVPVSITDVPIGGDALEVDAGGSQTCARLADGRLRCWGAGFGGQLGYGNTNSIGDDETPASAGDVPVGGPVIAQATGIGHTCVILASGAVRCWGSGSAGRLGYGNTNSVGDNETPASVGNVSAAPLGLPPTTKATALALGLNMSCALYETGDVLCWGAGSAGQLGQSSTNTIGDDELPSSQPPIVLPGPAKAITAGDTHVCALLESDEAICWGANGSGQLGYGNTDNIGDDESPASIGPLDLGGPVAQIDAGGNHTCALLAGNNQVLCWGNNVDGQLGYGNTDDIGDDELPSSAGPVALF